MKSRTLKFMTHFDAKKLFPSFELTPELEKALDKHLWYIKVAVIKDKIERVNHKGGDGIKQYMQDARYLAVEGYPLLAMEMMDILRILYPSIEATALYKSSIGKIHFKLGHISMSINSFTDAIQSNPKDPNNYLFRALAKEKLGDTTWELDYYKYEELAGIKDKRPIWFVMPI